jgi:hypothetical protein
MLARIEPTSDAWTMRISFLTSAMLKRFPVQFSFFDHQQGFKKKGVTGEGGRGVKYYLT